MAAIKTSKHDFQLQTHQHFAFGAEGKGKQVAQF